MQQIFQIDLQIEPESLSRKSALGSKLSYFSGSYALMPK